MNNLWKIDTCNIYIRIFVFIAVKVEVMQFLIASEMFSREEGEMVSGRKWGSVLEKMPAFESVPDPDRGDSPVSPSEAPPVETFWQRQHVSTFIS